MIEPKNYQELLGRSCVVLQDEDGWFGDNGPMGVIVGVWDPAEDYPESFNIVSERENSCYIVRGLKNLRLIDC